MPPPEPAPPYPLPGEGIAWTVIATPYTGEAHARGERDDTHAPALARSLALPTSAPISPSLPPSHALPLSFPGLAARTPLPRGTLIEVAPCLTISPSEYAGHGAGVRALSCYAFADPARSGGHLLALGCGSLFNHARAPNVDYRVDYKAAVVRFYAARDIEAGAELTISYGRVWWDEKGEGNGGVPGAPHDPAHDHMDDGDAFLGAIGLGSDREEDVDK